MESYTVRGAYGRTYTSKAAVLKDWKAGLDFKIVDGPYLNIADAAANLLFITVRYANDTKSMRVGY